MSDDIKLVYSGSQAEALWVEEILKENGIGSIHKDTLSSSETLGWGEGSPENDFLVYVETVNFEKAKSLLEEYFAKRNQSKNDNDKS